MKSINDLIFYSTELNHPIENGEHVVVFNNKEHGTADYVSDCGIWQNLSNDNKTQSDITHFLPVTSLHIIPRDHAV